jgi:methylmalonyl-CoA mutase
MRGNAPLAEQKKSGESVLTLAADFPQAAHDKWLKLVEKVLNGAPYDKKLVSRTYDGIALQPLYTQADWKADGDASGLPGGAPFTRGGRVLGTSVNGWDIRQAHAHPDPATANAEILQDLERGVTSIILKLDPTGANGIAVRTLADLDRVLKDVLLDLAPIVLECAGPPVPYIALLMALLEKRGVKADAFTGNFGLDGFAGIATRGKLTAPLETGLKRIADVASYVSKNYPKARAINLTTVVYHSAGASDAQELGCALAAGVEYLRAMTAAGLDVDKAANQIAFTTAVDADMFLSIAKIRALRKLWARVTEACGVALENRTAPITAQTAPRMMSKRDPWVNMLRTTVATFAAGVAGADAISVLPFSNAIGLPDDLARRVARNTQVVLQEESSIARVIDPAGGAWMFEKLTDELSEKAWQDCRHPCRARQEHRQAQRCRHRRQRVPQHQRSRCRAREGRSPQGQRQARRHREHRGSFQRRHDRKPGEGREGRRQRRRHDRAAAARRRHQHHALAQGAFGGGVRSPA